LTRTKVARQELEHLQKCLNDLDYYSRKHLFVVTKTGSFVKLKFRRAQQIVHRKLAEQRKAKGYVRAIILKARQEGITTGTAARYFREANFIPYRKIGIVAHKSKASENIFETYDRFHKNLDEDIRPARVSTTKGNYLELENGSIITVETAGDPDAFRSATLHRLHCCVPGDTRVLLADGFAVPISEVPEGARVLTHTGQEATVMAVSAKPAEVVTGQGEMVDVTPWLGETVRFTPDHKVWTQRGWVEAQDLVASDELSMPRRKVTDERLEFRLPEQSARPQGGGTRSKGAGETFPLTHETGFALGYYLAEGSIFYAKNGNPAGVVFTRHRSEVPYGQRAFKALAPFVRSRRVDDHSESLRTNEVLYGSALATFVEHQFGTKERKRVPEWVFQAGEGFAYGLVLGYLSGDGSKGEGKSGKYETPIVSATTISSSVATRMRDLVAAFGIGWGSLKRRDAGNYYGRNCKESWTVRWTGDAARTLRKDLGLPVSDLPSRGWISKSRIDDTHVWFKIRKLGRSRAEQVWDLAVDHPDHSFRTAYFAISNSEMAMWPNAEEVWTSLEETVPHDGGEIIIESTARGMGNLFHQMWEQAVAGESAFMPIFLPWWVHEEYRIKLSKQEREEILATQDPYERKCLDEGFFYDTAWGGDGKVHKLTPEQLAWRRFKIRSKKGNERAFRQENPATPEEAFLSTGDCFFDLDALAILDTKVKPPLYRGFFAEIGPTFHIQRDERGWLRVWEEPNKDRVYAIGADTAYGAQERIGFSEEEDEAKSRTDYSVAWVYDVAARRLVAQLHGKIAPESFARQINWLSYHYGTKTDSGDGGFTFPAKVGIERNHESGVTVIKKLQTEHRHPNLYFSRLVAVKSQGRQTSVCGWHTTKRTRGPMLDELSESVAAWKFDDADELAHKRVYIPDANTLREMRTFILHRSDRTDAIKAAAAEGAHDDRVLALGVTLQVAQTVTKPSPMRVQEPEVYDTPTGVIGYEYRDESYEIADNDEWLWGR
jgi:hypothetical protein